METHDEGAYRLVKVGPLGPFANNAYVIVDPAAGEAAIVDMPAEGEKVLEATAGLRVKRILLTHTHPDHWFTYDLLKDATGAAVHCHPAEVQMPADRIDVPLAGGQELLVGNIAVRVIHTPGHTPGSVCFLVGRYLISGDTLFPGGPGHSDTPEALQQSIRSIVQRLCVLPDDTLVLPGHGDDTTIGASRREYSAFASRPHAPDLCGDVLWETG
jgi:glyoxylase-like metal-dependent hydrolase (beta-lactamase superfamily II)